MVATVFLKMFFSLKMPELTNSNFIGSNIDKRTSRLILFVIYYRLKSTILTNLNPNPTNLTICMITTVLRKANQQRLNNRYCSFNIRTIDLDGYLYTYNGGFSQLFLQHFIHELNLLTKRKKIQRLTVYEKWTTDWFLIYKVAFYLYQAYFMLFCLNFKNYSSKHTIELYRSETVNRLTIVRKA